MSLTRFTIHAHQGTESRDQFLTFLKTTREGHPDWALAATLFLPRRKVAYSLAAATDYDEYADYVIADPDIRKMALPYSERSWGRHELTYLKETRHTVNREPFVDAVLRAQAENGRRILISPWLAYGESGTRRELDITVDYAQRALDHDLANGREVWIGIEATQAVLTTGQGRDALLNELVELPEAPVYLRMRTAAGPGRTMLSDVDTVNALRLVVSTLADNDRPVALPQSGLLGWLMMPYGARAFGAGISGTMQRNLAPGGGGGGGQPPLNWYFVPQLLGFVRADELYAVGDVEGYEPSPSPFSSGVPGDVVPRFDARGAGNHFLWWCARLANELNAGDVMPLDRVRARLAAASAFWGAIQEAGVVLDSRSQPTHLAAWTQATG